MILMTKYPIKNKMHYWQHSRSNWVSIVTIISLLIIWELVCRSGLISPLFLPAPSRILLAVWHLFQTGELQSSLMASLYRIFFGFLLGSSLGLIIGLITGTSSLIDKIGTPIIQMIYPIPKIALLPLFILWLGIGELSKVTIIALGVFFPIVMNTYSGVKNVDPLLIKVAVSFDATKSRILRTVVFPSALPTIFAGFKLAAGTSLLLLVAAEMVAASEGIGALILHYGDLMLTDKLMAGVLVLSILGLLFQLLIQFIEKRIVHWKN